MNIKITDEAGQQVSTCTFDDFIARKGLSAEDADAIMDSLVNHGPVKVGGGQLPMFFLDINFDA